MYEFTLLGNMNASLHSVYSAFVSPQAISRWCSPNNLFVYKYIGAIGAGKSFRLILQGHDGFQQNVTGTYHEVSKNERLVFTWRWEDTNDISKISIEFAESANATTLLTITQTGFKYRNDMLMQKFAWIDVLEKLSVYLAGFNKESNISYIQPQLNGSFFNALPA